MLANILYGQPWSEIEEELETVWKNRPRLPSLPFRPAYYCTKEFHDWWQSYFTIYVGAPEAKLSELTEAFVYLQAKSTKCKALHVKQIRAFQNYFQVVYRLDNLRGTIWEAAVELKEKVTDRLPKLKIPGYAKDKYLYALHFGNLKFPALPSSPWLWPLVMWFRCGFIVPFHTYKTPIRKWPTEWSRRSIICLTTQGHFILILNMLVCSNPYNLETLL